MRNSLPDKYTPTNPSALAVPLFCWYSVSFTTAPSVALTEVTIPVPPVKGFCN